jgi:hypothetical protein
MTIGDRGNIPAGIRRDYEAEMALEAELDGAGAEDLGPPPQAASVPLRAAPDWSGDAAPDMAETRPGPPGPRGPRLRVPAGLRKPRTPAKGKAKAKPRHPRQSLAPLISDIWQGLAAMARPLPATSRLLRLQSQLAGVVFEEALANTIMDSVLQPFARTGKNAELVWAMVGAPALVTMAQLQPDQLPVILPLLRSALMTMVRVAGPRMETALKEERAFEEQHGDTVDAIIVFLLQGVPVPDGQTEAQAEAEAMTALHEEMAS